MKSNTKAVIKYFVMTAVAMFIINIGFLIFVWAVSDLSGDFSFAYNNLQFSLNGTKAGLALGSPLFIILFTVIFFSLFLRAARKKEIIFKR